MADKDIESLEFRRHARRNCYRYGPLFIYSDRMIILDEHNFPSYDKKDSTGAVEKFLSLVQSLGSIASGNDAQQKLAKPLPGVAWGSDSLSYTIGLQGTMYFMDYRDYIQNKKNIRREFLSQGWKQLRDKSDKLGISVMSYIPNNSGERALFNDDPVDAAGTAMMVSAMQNATLQVKRLSANLRNEVGDYALTSRDIETRQAIAAIRHDGLVSSLGSFGVDLANSIDAFGANMNSGLVTKWATAGHPVELLVEGESVARSVNGVLVTARLTEKSYVVDGSSGDQIYPTAMDVSIDVKNMYGALLNTSSGG